MKISGLARRTAAPGGARPGVRLLAGVCGLVVLALAGCGDSEAGDAPPPASPAEDPAGDGDEAALPQEPCLVGQWTSVGMEMQINEMSAAGGAGATMDIEATGETLVDFTGMEPIEFTVGGPVSSAGHFVYTGTTSGELVLPPPDATSGDWEQAGEGTYDGFGVHMVITDPFEMDLGPMSLDDWADADEFGGAISTEPVVEGGWTCEGDRLVSTGAPEVDVTWTFARN